MGRKTLLLLALSLAALAATGGAVPAAPSVSLQVVLENPNFATLAVAGDVAYGKSVSDEHSIWRSDDHGLTWTKALSLASNQRPTNISALADGTVLAQVDTGAMSLFRSADQGATWTQVLSLPTSPVFYTTLTAASITDGGGYVWLGTYNISPAGSTYPAYLYRSADDGRTWTVVNTATGHRHIHAVKFNPANGKLYVFFGDSRGDAIWVSSDNGATLSPLCTLYACVAVDAAFDPAGSFMVFGQDNYRAQNRIVKVSLASGALTEVLNLPYDSFGAHRLSASTYLIGTTKEPDVALGDPNLHLYVSVDGATTFTDLYQTPIPAGSSGRTDLKVQFSYPNGDFPIQISGRGTIVARLTTGSPTPPVSTALPTVSGTAQEGQVLTAARGVWTGSQPISFSQQWQRCGSTSCVDIGGATDLAYSPVAADVGFTLRIRVTASNSAGGPVSANSAQTSAVTALPATSPSSGGGGSGVPDLKVSLSVSTTTLAAGGESDLVALVTNGGTQTSTRTHLLITLPSTLTLLGPPTFDRGSGCTGSKSIDCDLDFLPVGVTTRVSFAVRVDGQGTITVAASANTEANPADNAASVTVGPGQPLTPPTVPAAPPRPLLGKAVAVPLQPLAGKRFTFTLPVKRSDTGKPLTAGKMICDPSVVGKVISHAESFTNGTVRLSFTVPKSAKGKQLRVKVKIVNGAQSALRVFTYKVH